MEDMTQLVAQNLRKLREEKKLSLDKLAEMTGVSKSMLGQIERGDSSPTIATVWKIANGLKVSFTSLLETPQSNTRLVRRADVTPMVEDQGKYRLFPLFPIEEGRRFEVYTVEIDPGGHMSAEAHAEGTQEFITVFSGELSLSVEGEDYRVAQGDAIRFRADRPHAYHNAGNSLVKVSMVIHYG
jgi:XRE family transcriptional regulator, regulator of sulfur utilization